MFDSKKLIDYDIDIGIGGHQPQSNDFYIKENPSKSSRFSSGKKMGGTASRIAP